jgi:CheY-like chemotaxis protein
MEQPLVNRVLVVEDIQDHADLLVTAFLSTEAKPDVVTFQNGLEALDYLLQRGSFEGVRSATPRLIVLDLHLPGLGGLDLLKRLKLDPRTRTLPVVVCTVSRNSKALEQAMALGADGHFVKPLGESAFFETVRQVSRQWLETRGGDRSPPTQAFPPPV